MTHNLFLFIKYNGMIRGNSKEDPIKPLLLLFVWNKKWNKYIFGKFCQITEF